MKKQIGAGRQADAFVFLKIYILHQETKTGCHDPETSF